MLARENRLISAEDFRSTMRSGRKIASNYTVTYLHFRTASVKPKFGFVVAKSVGNAVGRNQVKRRLRAIARQIINQNQLTGWSIVVRALENSSQATFDELEKEFSNAVTTALEKKAE